VERNQRRALRVCPGTPLVGGSPWEYAENVPRVRLRTRVYPGCECKRCEVLLTSKKDGGGGGGHGVEGGGEVRKGPFCLDRGCVC